MINGIKLKIEHLINPIGIDIARPRLFWKVEGAIKQTAYQIKAEYCDGKIAWDRGQIESRSMFADYAGASLQSRDRIYWKVRLWDEEGNVGDWSEASFFEIGLLKESDWIANWITANLTIEKEKRYPSDYFKKQFTVAKQIVYYLLWLVRSFFEWLFTTIPCNTTAAVVFPNGEQYNVESGKHKFTC
jgi:alpha-L-rhamnosidase